MLSIVAGSDKETLSVMPYVEMFHLYSELFTQALLGGKCMTRFTITQKFGIASVL